MQRPVHPHLPPAPTPADVRAERLSAQLVAPRGAMVRARPIAQPTTSTSSIPAPTPQLFYSFFKTLVGKEVVVELKNGASAHGEHSAHSAQSCGQLTPRPPPRACAARPCDSRHIAFGGPVPQHQTPQRLRRGRSQLPAHGAPCHPAARRLRGSALPDSAQRAPPGSRRHDGIALRPHTRALLPTPPAAPAPATCAIPRTPAPAPPSRSNR